MSEILSFYLFLVFLLMPFLCFRKWQFPSFIMNAKKGCLNYGRDFESIMFNKRRI
jgi:hypothetical protein